MEGRVEVAFEEIKSLINNMTLQHNEIRSQLNNQEEGTNRGSILGNPVSNESSATVANNHNLINATK